MRVKFNGIDLGATTGNVTVSISTEKAELHADQLGSHVIDRVISGGAYTVTTELAEVALKDNWKVVFPHMDLITSGANKLGSFKAMIGAKDSDYAQALLLHPLSLPDANLSGDYKFFKAAADGNSELVYGPGDQVKLKLVWNVYPDFSTQPARFFVQGDPGIGVVAASVGSPVFTGTGNGTMTGVVAYSGVSVTETITAKVVTPAANGGVFSVSGSVSGPLGLATVGVSFVSGVVSFTINDGATDFALNDQFTIAITAANYA